MRVNQTGSNTVQGAEASNVASAKQTRAAAAAQATKKNAPAAGSGQPIATDAAKAEISAKGKEFAKAKEVANNAPDVREEKIAALKAKIAAGKYKVDAEAVADRMVDEHLKAGIG